MTATHQNELDALNTTISNSDILAESLKNDLKDVRTRIANAKKDKKNISHMQEEMELIQQEQKENRENKKVAEKELMKLQKIIEEEIKSIIKKKFDYKIPIAKVDDAGITATGSASSGNQLPTLVAENMQYRSKNNLWDVSALTYSYIQKDDGNYYRVFGNQEVVLNV